MNNTQLALFIEDKIRLLEKAFEQVDGSMSGADRHVIFEYIGNSQLWRISGISEEEHQRKYPLDWSEEFGTAKCLDPIKGEIEALKECVEALKSDSVKLAEGRDIIHSGIPTKIEFVEVGGESQIHVNGDYSRLTKRFVKMTCEGPLESDDLVEYSPCESLPF